MSRGSIVIESWAHQIKENRAIWLMRTFYNTDNEKWTRSLNHEKRSSFVLLI